MFRSRAILSTVALVLLTAPTSALAQGMDLTLFVGAASPIYADRLTFRASVPSLPGVAITSPETPELRANGGLVFGGALAFELGILGIEGRLDSTEVGLDLSGGRYDFRGTSFPFDGLTASIGVGDGRFDADRLHLLSANVRLRTPGPIGIVASGGLSYLNEVVINGSAPVAVQVAGLALPSIQSRLRLRAVPGESGSRVGVNGGAGLRIGGGRLALLGEVRVFYFRDFELRVDVDNAPAALRDVLDGMAPIRFEPVIVNAQGGIVLRF